MFSRPTVSLAQLHPPTGREVLLGQFKLLPQAERNSCSADLAYCSTLAHGFLLRDVVTDRSMGKQQRLLLAGTCPQGTEESLHKLKCRQLFPALGRDMPLRWCPRLIFHKATPALWLCCPIQSIPNQFCHANVPDAF